MIFSLSFSFVLNTKVTQIPDIYKHLQTILTNLQVFEQIEKPILNKPTTKENKLEKDVSKNSVPLQQN